MLICWFDDLLVGVLLLGHSFAEHGPCVDRVSRATLDHANDLGLRSVVSDFVRVQKGSQLVDCSEFGHLFDGRELDQGLCFDFSRLGCEVEIERLELFLG